MSYQQFRQHCLDCKLIWNAAFGIVHTTIIAEPPKICPGCGSIHIEHYANSWDIDLWDTETAKEWVKESTKNGLPNITMALLPTPPHDQSQVLAARTAEALWLNRSTRFPPIGPSTPKPLLRRLAQALATLLRGQPQ